jgi:type IV pilus assembly protein PilO
MALVQTDRYRQYRHYFVGLGSLYKKKQARVYTGIVLTIFTVSFFGFFAIRPTLVTISGLLKEIKDKKGVVKQMDDKITALANAQTNYSQVEEELYLVDQSLPLDPDLASLMKQLEVLARANSVTLESIQYNKINLLGEIEKEEGQKAGFSISLSGSYDNLKQFLHSLDNLRRIILVDSFSFSTKTEEEMQVLMLNVTAKAYYLTKNQ